LEFGGLIGGEGMKGLGGGGALGFGEQVGLIVFQGHNPVQPQSFDGAYKRSLQIKGVRHQHVQKAAPQALNQLLQQGQRAGHLTLAVLLKTDAERDGEAAAHHGDQADAMVVLELFVHLSVDLMLHLPFHALGAATHVGAADFDAINGGYHQAPRPSGSEHAIAFQLSGDRATQVEQGGRILPLQHITDVILADGADAMAKDALPAFGLNTVEGTALASAAQEDGIEDFGGGDQSVVTAIRQGLYPMREVEHLVEPDLQLVSAQS
jgi:hypothetical protein